MKKLAAPGVAMPMQVRRTRLLAERRVAPYLLVLILCSMVDWALTADAITMGIAREGNPLMSFLIDLDPAAFLAVKLVVPVVGGLVLYLFRGERYARFGIKLLACAYVLLVAYHVIGRMFILPWTY